MHYDQLSGLPMLNGVTLLGDRTIEDYGMVQMSSDDVNSLILEVWGYLLE